MTTEIFEPWSSALNVVNEVLFPVSAGRAAQQFYCGVRREYPWAFYTAVVAGMAEPARAMHYLQLSRYCPTEPSPTPRSEPALFTGGQCPGVQYQVGGFVKLRNTALLGVGSPPLPSPIRSVIWTTTQLPNSRVQRSFRVVYGNNFVTQEYIVTDQFSPMEPEEYRYVFVARPDGQPDNCGNTTVIYPPPITPPPTTFNITVNLTGQPQSVEIELPELNVDDWPNFTFEPVIRWGDVTFRYESEGVRITMPGNLLAPSLNTSVNVDLNPVLNAIGTVNNNISTNFQNVIGNTNNNTAEIRLDIAELKDSVEQCCCDKDVTYEAVTIVTDTEGGRFTLPENTVSVRIDGSNVDTNFIRTQSGSGFANDVFYWGWYSVGYASGADGDRIPLHYLQQAASTNEHAKTITVNPTYGARATIVATVKTETTT